MHRSLEVLILRLSVCWKGRLADFREVLKSLLATDWNILLDSFGRIETTKWVSCSPWDSRLFKIVPLPVQFLLVLPQFKGYVVVSSNGAVLSSLVSACFLLKWRKRHGGGQCGRQDRTEQSPTCDFITCRLSSLKTCHGHTWVHRSSASKACGLLRGWLGNKHSLAQVSEGLVAVSTHWRTLIGWENLMTLRLWGTAFVSVNGSNRGWLLTEMLPFRICPIGVPQASFGFPESSNPHLTAKMQIGSRIYQPCDLGKTTSRPS